MPARYKCIATCCAGVWHYLDRAEHLSERRLLFIRMFLEEVVNQVVVRGEYAKHLLRAKVPSELETWRVAGAHRV